MPRLRGRAPVASLLHPPASCPLPLLHRGAKRNRHGGHHHDGLTDCDAVRMTIDDFGVPAGDASFANNPDALTGGPRADNSWNAMPLNNGTFSAACLLGHFHRRDHEELSGQFLREVAIDGVFGTAR